MAVLVQPQIDAVVSGVLFGADPVSGRRDRLVASIAEGTPDDLVSGRVNGSQLTLTKRGRVLRTEGDPLPAVVDRRVRRRLADLAGATARRFGGPQDMEWALDRHGALWLLQSRPITTVATPSKRRGSVWGPAPVAETFPAPLRRLEDDLWITPLAEGLDRALRITGAAAPSPRRATGPLVRTVGGWVVADLTRLGADPGAKRSFFSRLNPRPPMWRLRVAWRVGRLRLAIGAIGRDVVLAADAALGEVPDPRELDDSELIGTLISARASLVSLNAHEALAGMLLPAGVGTDAATSPAASGVVAAHRALAEGRRAGWTDAEIIAREPSVLALLPASIPPQTELPATATALADLTPEAGPSDTDAAVVREALRLRIRWTHELMGQLALEAGRRLAEREALTRPEQVGDLGLSELLGALRTRRPCPLEVVPATDGPPPPDRFRLSADGGVAPLPASSKGAGPRSGLGAGGGRGAGEVWDLADGPPPAGAVVVTRFLDPGLAAHLPGLAGLVAETGSVLSHLAIVARELGIPTVVGAAGAIDRFPAGTPLLVDGHTGEVRTRSTQLGEQ
jgi:pyruvate,water dikinase